MPNGSGISCLPHAEIPRRYVFPATPLAQFAQDMQTKLKARTLRVVGDPRMPVNRVTASWGYMSALPMAARPEIEVLVVGERRAWELVEYSQDCITPGQKKALIIVGHVLSELACMKYCAEWLKTLVTEAPVQSIAAPEPCWSPNNPTE